VNKHDNVPSHGCYQNGGFEMLDKLKEINDRLDNLEKEIKALKKANTGAKVKGSAAGAKPRDKASK
jgi:hypothetical protein